MSIARYLTLKSEIIYEHQDSTLRQLLERMNRHSYSAIPILDDDGVYLGTVTEGDILRQVQQLDSGQGIKALEKIKLTALERKLTYQPVGIDAELKDVLFIVEHQNFVPVVDDHGIFIGIIKRSAIIRQMRNILLQSTMMD